MSMRAVSAKTFACAFAAGMVALLAAPLSPAVAQVPQAVVSGVQSAPRLDFSAEEMALARAVSGNPQLAAFYGRNGLKPVFTAPEGAAFAAALRGAVARMPDHGLPLARYRPEALASATAGDVGAEVLHARILARVISDLTGGMVRPASADTHIHREVPRRPVADLMNDFLASPDPAGFLAGLGPQDPRYRLLQDALADRARLSAPAGTPPAPEGVWRTGARDARLADLRARLVAVGFDAGPAADPAIYDAGLEQAVTAYQQAAGLPADGIAGPRTIQRLNAGADRQTRAILIALERMRWMGSHDLNARHVWVNIPDYMVRVFDGGQQIFQTRAVLGKTSDDMQTPEFSDEMEYVVVNPSWNVPPGMFARDYFPRLQQNRHAFPHLDVVNRRGQVVPRDQVDFAGHTARSFPHRLRQRPSDDNALGIVKFIFPNPWNIYLHDTPSKGLFSETTRAFSNGCVRVRDPLDLSHLLLSQQTDNPQRMFQRARDSGRETYLKLTPFVPVHLVYFTAFPDDSGQIRFYNDIYGRDARVWQALVKAGLEPDA